MRSSSWLRSADMTDLTEYRRARDRFFAEDVASPLSDEDRETFTGLDYFPEDPALVLRVPFHPATGTVEIAHSTGLPRHYHLVGTVDVTLGDQVFPMTVLDGGDDNAFLPFRDASSGVDTYEGGRYVPVEVLDDGTAGVDFNLAYIGPDFTYPHKEEFDTEYMRKLFDYAYQLAVKGYPWKKTPPGYNEALPSK